MREGNRDVKARLAYLALYYAIIGQTKKSESLRRLGRRMS